MNSTRISQAWWKVTESFAVSPTHSCLFGVMVMGPDWESVGCTFEYRNYICLSNERPSLISLILIQNRKNPIDWFKACSHWVTATAMASSFMNGSNGMQWGCSHWGGSNGNGNGVVMEWVGYPFVMAMATATHLIALHCILPLPLPPLPIWTVATMPLPLPLLSVNGPL